LPAARANVVLADARAPRPLKVEPTKGIVSPAPLLAVAARYYVPVMPRWAHDDPVRLTAASRAQDRDLLSINAKAGSRPIFD
jgi:hypothetical protein